MTRYQRHSSTLSTELGDEVIALQLDTQFYYSLNSSAACVWRALGDGVDEEEATRALADHFGLEEDAARPHVTTLLAELLRLRLAEPTA
ncbi:MAG: PqqD family protein [Gemmatimonadaceae bacterium]